MKVTVCEMPEERSEFGGRGLVVDPDGEVLGLATGDGPFAAVEVDMERARTGKGTYPRGSFGGRTSGP